MKLISYFLRAIEAIWQLFVTQLPGPVGNTLRYRFWSKRLKYLGDGVKIDVGVHISNPAFVSLDDGSWIDRNVIIIAGKTNDERVTCIRKIDDFPIERGEVYIGAYTHIAPNCVLSGIGGVYVGKNCGVASNSLIYSFSHHYQNLTDSKDNRQYSFTPRARVDQQAMLSAPVYIDDYCAVGLSCVVLPGTVIRKGSWVGSGTVIRGKYSEQVVLGSEIKIVQKSISHLTIAS